MYEYNIADDTNIAVQAWVDQLRKLFTHKMEKGLRSQRRGWSAREIMDEITLEQCLISPSQKDVWENVGVQKSVWRFFTEEMLGYTQSKLKELEHGWQRNRTRQQILSKDGPLARKKPSHRSPYSLS